MRALWILLSDSSDVPAAGSGNGFATRANLPDEDGPRRTRRDDAVVRAAFRSLSRVPCMCDGVSVRGPVRAAHREVAGPDRATLRAPGRRPPGPPAAPGARSIPTAK